MDIGSGKGYPSSALSNFAPHHFVFRGIPVASPEGFLQGLKFKDPEVQKQVFQLVGRAAKFRGKGKRWFVDQTLYFQGQPIRRDSKEYQELLNEMYHELFTQNESARKALLATQNAVLKHSIGKNDQSKTVLTESEFCSRLSRIRRELQENEQ